MQISDLILAQQVIQQFLNRKLPAEKALSYTKLTYALIKNQHTIDQELELYDKARLKLLQDNWLLNKETNKYDIPPEDEERWHSMVDELVSTKVEFKPYLFPQELLKSLDLTPVEALAISWMIKE